MQDSWSVPVFGPPVTMDVGIVDAGADHRADTRAIEQQPWNEKSAMNSRCVGPTHHRHLHRSGNEAAWSQAVNHQHQSLDVAKRLWEEKTHQGHLQRSTNSRDIARR